MIILFVVVGDVNSVFGSHLDHVLCVDGANTGQRVDLTLG